MVRLTLRERQVTVRLGSNLKSFLSLTLVDVKLELLLVTSVLIISDVTVCVFRRVEETSRCRDFSSVLESIFCSILEVVPNLINKSSLNLDMWKWFLIISKFAERTVWNLNSINTLFRVTKFYTKAKTRSCLIRTLEYGRLWWRRTGGKVWHDWLRQ